MLVADNLAFGYRQREVGEGVSFSIRQGEVLCLLGPNGCGKTTLFKTLLGLLPRQGGTLELDGKDVATFSRAAFARRVAYVPQAGTAYFPFEVIDIVEMGRAIRVGAFSSPSPTDRAAAEAALDTLGIRHLSGRSYTTLSGGERQMVLIARALAQEPGMIVMDEPTASLDFGNQARVLEVVRTLSGEGLAIVISTHDPGQAFAVADRVALMKDGRMVAIGPTKAVLTATALKALYQVDVAITFLEGAGHNVCAPAMSGHATLKTSG